MPRSHSTTGNPISRIYVDYALTGSARITWELREDFIDPTGSYYYTLQVNPNRSETDRWEDVGIEIFNQFYALDDTQRQHGKDLRVSYRVKVRTVWDTYTSEPAQVLGNLSKRQWLQARAIMRRVILNPKGLENFPGYLMKRRLHSTVCTDCVDPITGGITNSDCDECKGTGRIGGYWTSTSNTMFDASPEPENTKRSPMGTVNDSVIMGRFLGIPELRRNDVWIDANSDRRYFVQSVLSRAEVNRVPVVVDAELRLAEFSDIVYDINIDEGS